MKTLTSISTALIVALALPVASSATILFSNLAASSPQFQTSIGNSVGNDDVGDVLGEADTFTPVSTAMFSDVMIALSCLSANSCPDALSVALRSDSSGVPGATLESFSVPGGSLQVLGGSSLITLTSILHPTLTAGVHYWITVLADGNDHAAWNLNNTGDSSIELLTPDNGTSWFDVGQTPGAYKIDGNIVSTVPEPGTAGVLIAGGALLALTRRLRRR